jgi:hypothetical protein
MRRALLSLLALATLAGCPPKNGLVTAATPTPVDFASVLESAVDGEVESDDTALNAIQRELERRNLTPVVREISGPHRARLDLLAEGASGMVLLVESTTRFSSQMNGRYRWTVDVHARLAEPDALGRPLEARFTVPVHLLFAHEAENDALIAATPSIANRVGNLLDEWLRAVQNLEANGEVRRSTQLPGAGLDR